MSLSRVKGCYDLLPNGEGWRNSYLWSFFEDQVKHLTNLYQFQRIDLPALEHREVFMKTAGETSDLITKEIYTFQDRGGRWLALRPEVTASFIRAYIENNLSQSAYDSFYYISSCWRYERAQRGRYRQFSQFGVEFIGGDTIYGEYETISLLISLCKSLGLQGARLVINNIGTISDRIKYIEDLKKYFRPHKKDLSEESQKRIEINPLRILDSKNSRDIEISAKAPNILEYIPESSLNSFEALQGILSSHNIPYVVSNTLVRGLDYYTGLVYEVIYDGIGAKNSLGGGGRYDGLMKDMGGPNKSSVGFAVGIERMIEAMITSDTKINEPSVDYFIVPICEMGVIESLKCQKALRDNGHKVKGASSVLTPNKGINLALSYNAKFLLIIGTNELESGKIKIKDLSSRKERLVKISDLGDEQ